MKTPLFVHKLRAEEREGLEAGLRSQDAFSLRRCQIVLASDDGQKPSIIAKNLRCASQTVRNVIHDFEQRGLACLQPGSNVPLSVEPVLTAEKREQVRAMLHQSPRNFGKPTSVWTLKLLAEVCHEQGLSQSQLSAPTILDAVVRLGVSWKRAKHWVVSPDPAYELKKNNETASFGWQTTTRILSWALKMKSGGADNGNRTCIAGLSRSRCAWFNNRCLARTQRAKPSPVMACICPV